MPQGDKRGEDKADPWHHFGLEMVQKAGLELAVVTATGQKPLRDHHRTVHWERLILFDSTNVCLPDAGPGPTGTVHTITWGFICSFEEASILRTPSQTAGTDIPMPLTASWPCAPSLRAASGVHAATQSPVI